MRDPKKHRAAKIQRDYTNILVKEQRLGRRLRCAGKFHHFSCSAQGDQLVQQCRAHAAILSSGRALYRAAAPTGDRCVCSPRKVRMPSMAEQLRDPVKVWEIVQFGLDNEAACHPHANSLMECCFASAGSKLSVFGPLFMCLRHGSRAQSKSRLVFLRPLLRPGGGLWPWHPGPYGRCNFLVTVVVARDLRLCFEA